MSMLHQVCSFAFNNTHFVSTPVHEFASSAWITWPGLPFPISCFLCHVFFILFLSFCFAKSARGFFKVRRRRRIFSCQRRAGKRCSWSKRPKMIRMHICALQIARWVFLLLLLSFGASFVYRNSAHDVVDAICTQPAVSRFFATYSSKMRRYSSWSISRLVRNKIQRSMDGNVMKRMKGTQGKGHGKSKKGMQVAAIDEEQLFKQEIRNALPQAVFLRMMPQFYPEDWTVPVRNPFDMSATEGVSLRQTVSGATPARFMVLEQVGYTHNRVAILTTQNVSQLHLLGYPCQELSIRVLVLPDDGSGPKEVYIRRFLIQLGFGPHVELKSAGERAQLPETMVKLVAKLPVFFGWTPDCVRGSALTRPISQHTDLRAIESLQTREDHSATFYARQTEVPDLLKASGPDGLFIKVHADF